MSFHTCWDVKAPGDTPGVPVPEMLERLALAFPVHSFDADGAMADMAKQIAAMESLGFPEEILGWYRNARPVLVVLSDAPDAPFVLKFTVAPDPALGPDPAGPVRSVLASFATPAHQEACFPLLVRVAELAVEQTFDERHAVAHLLLELCWVLAAVGVERGADFGRNREARRYWDLKVGHLCEAGALTSEEVAHVSRAVGLTAAEQVDELGRG